MEADRFGAALEYRTLEVVIEHDPGNGAPCGERLDVAAQEVVHRAVQIKPQEQMSRVGEHHDEGHQRPGRLADGDCPEVRPVALGLFTGKGAQT
jgi:hypothetical protein